MPRSRKPPPASSGAKHGSAPRTTATFVWASRIRVAALLLSCVVAFAVRLFPILRFEVGLTEFAPQFHLRAVRHVVQHGLVDWHSWFDVQSWYPFGRNVGTSVHPALILVSAALHAAVNLITPVSIITVCVLVAPALASIAALLAYHAVREAMRGTRSAGRDTSTQEAEGQRAGLLACAFLALAPGYVGSSTSGSFAVESLAVCALVFAMWAWMRAVRTGSPIAAVWAAFAYWVVAASWAGYLLLTLAIPAHALCLLVTRRYSSRLYVAYSVWYMGGMLAVMQIPFVGFAPLMSFEHMMPLAVFAAVQVVAFTRAATAAVKPEAAAKAQRAAIVTVVCGAAVCCAIACMSGAIAPPSRRLWALLDPTYAKEHVPVLASMSQNQPSAWASFFFDLHIIVILLPVGLLLCFTRATDGQLFLATLAVATLYMAAVMVRFVVILTPVACMVAAIAASEVLARHAAITKSMLVTKQPAAAGQGTRPSGGKKAQSKRAGGSSRKETASLARAEQFRHASFIAVIVIVLMLLTFVRHSTWVASELYSSSSILVSAKQPDGSRLRFDDFREAYSWLRTNTPDDAKVLAWWDYGYQLAGMANRTVFVDNSAGNETQLATVARALAAPEAAAVPVLRSMGVEYVMVTFGGLTGYTSDDLNKFLWMLRIGAGRLGDVEVDEAAYVTASGQFRVDKRAPQAMLDSLLYHLSYHRFADVKTLNNKPVGYDRVRKQVIGNKDIELRHFQEAMTSEHWIVRIYKLLPEDNRHPLPTSQA